MYELRTFSEGGALLDYLNDLGAHEITYLDHQTSWTVLVKKSRIGRPPKKVEELKPVDAFTSIPKTLETPPNTQTFITSDAELAKYADGFGMHSAS